MRVCPGIKRDGGRCTVVVSGKSDYCYQHDPERAEERRRTSSRAAKSRPSREVAAIKALLADMTERVLSGGLETSVAAVANQLINTQLRAIELERKIKETEELEARIEALEEMRNAGGGRRWRA